MSSIFLSSLPVRRDVDTMVFVVEETSSYDLAVHVGVGHLHAVLVEELGLSVDSIIGGGVISIDDDTAKLWLHSGHFGGIPSMLLEPLRDDLQMCFIDKLIIIDTKYWEKGKNSHRIQPYLSSPN